MDRLTSMAVFVKAADLGSFTAAAAALGMSSQMVGKHVTFLEQRLGASLLQRTTRQQSLTAIGQAFYDRSRSILAEAAAAETLVEELSTTPQGRLRVSAPVTFGACRVAPLVTRYLRTYPDMKVELTLTDRYVDVVDEGYDAVIRLGDLADSGLTSRALAPYRLLACASPAYLSRHGAPAVPAELAAHDCLGWIYWSGRAYEDWEFRKAGRLHKVRVHARLQVNDGRVLRAAAVEGHGIILHAEVVVEDDLSSGALVPVLPGYEAPSRPMHILFSRDARNMPKLRTFIDMVVESFGRGDIATPPIAHHNDGDRQEFAAVSRDGRRGSSRSPSRRS